MIQVTKEQLRMVYLYTDSKIEFSSILDTMTIGGRISPSPKVYSELAINTKLAEAAVILISIGIDKAHHTKVALLAFLSLCGITPDTDWKDATANHMGLTKDIMEFISANYGISYKANSRESFRKEAINLFLNHRIIDLNPGDPYLGPTSPKTHYAITQSVLKQIKL